ncbi:MAG: ABC transporter ATP-binding protein [Pseudomonadota bacterium]
MTPLLEVNGLSVGFHSRNGSIQAVRDLSFSVAPDETLAIVGESGSGKSVTALSLMRLIEREGGAIDAGSILFDGRDVTTLPEAGLRALRGNDISMIFQEPMTSLNPVMTIGDQITETILQHNRISPAQARTRALDMLTTVRLSDPQMRLSQYPHELSGGMRQRVMIAIALACQPRLLIADEPTTALDVTIQAEILDLIRALKSQTGAAVIFITHDMGVVAEIADRVVVMRHGQKVEEAPTRQLFEAPAAGYTRTLIDAAPRLGDGAPVLAQTAPPLLDVDTLITRFPIRKGLLKRSIANVHAVEQVSLTLAPGETLGLVGESGSGKSTIGRSILKLVDPTGGHIRLDGQDLVPLSGAAMKPLRKDVQMIFQDPYASLNPRLKIVDVVTEPLIIHTDMPAEERRAVAADLIRRVSLHPDALDRYPHQFSGGQRQRLCIARALSSRPKLIIADEPVSALDVSVQAQVLDLLLELQQEAGVAYLFISHDIAVVEKISHRIAVLHRGRVIETGRTGDVLSNPQHPYTRRLLAAVPVPDPTAARARVETAEIAPSPTFPVGSPTEPLTYTDLPGGHRVLTTT